MDWDRLLGILTFAVEATAVLALYFAPTLIAHKRKPLAAFSIYNINLFLGWTGIGWLYALYLSLRSPTEE